MLNEFVKAKNDPQQQLIGQAYVTAQSQLNPADVLPREIYAKQPLYAHFDTFGKVPPNAQVMVRWTQRDTGEILLFTPRKVSENQQNWVSFYPVLGWLLPPMFAGVAMAFSSVSVVGNSLRLKMKK